MRKISGWRCPTCGRRFVQRTREHSCDVRSLEMHLSRASDEVRATFEKLQAVLNGLGPHGVVPVKTMVLLRGTSNFGSIVVRRSALELGFASTRLQSDSRIHKTERLGPDRYVHRTRVSLPAHVDAQVARWLKEAYRLGVPRTRG